LKSSKNNLKKFQGNFPFWAGFLLLKNQETTMLEILESLATVVIMVPVMIALLLGSIYGLGELFNLFSAVGGKKS
jgi:hypothetical protein